MGHQMEGEDFHEVFAHAKREFRVSDEEYERLQRKKEFEAVYEGDSKAGRELTLQDMREEEESQRMAAGFDWSARLEHVEELREGIQSQSRSMHFLGVVIQRDEGCEEAVEALDEIEMQVRERMASGEEDRELLRKVDQSLEAMERLIRCREQRDTIDERFKGEKARQRVAKLDRKEAEIRAEIRSAWEVGTAPDQLRDTDPVSAYESKAN